MKALNVSMVMLVCGHTLDILMYQRWNRVVGIPDWLFMVGKSSITGNDRDPTRVNVLGDDPHRSYSAPMRRYRLHDELPPNDASHF